MKTHSMVAAFSLALIFGLSLMAPVAHAAEASESGASFRPARIRAFAPESPTSLVLREGRSRFVRLTLAEGCPALTQASRLAFQSGPTLAVADEGGSRVPVVRGQAPAVVSNGTRNQFVVAITANSRAACRLAGVTVVDQAAFDGAAQLHGSQDNRYAGDGRPAG